ncbi:hypothetical protein [Mucilaginibacter terrae]|uniref:Amino acid transporter n=1 Tax=Mucilaginibacter terrae TaxID=1955052 RepID=A0ABU3GRL4_9SPHI|nr:hypothetical protein [Mucilaginibacter terrae]MDT3401602.1 amino acid transporter [Mucilaginibacter terrae]
MKNKGLVISAVVLFLLVNTSYYWEGQLGVLAFPADLLLVIAFLILAIALIRQFYFSIKERFKNKHRSIIMGLLTITLGLILYRPGGLIDFDKLEGNDVLMAEREGAANCMTVFKLKDNFTFKERSVCFGVVEVKGRYSLKNDTIYFNNVKTGLYTDGFYMFAVITPSIYQKDGKHFDITLFKNKGDSLGYTLPITKSELNRIKNAKLSRY